MSNLAAAPPTPLKRAKQGKKGKGRGKGSKGKGSKGKGKGRSLAFDDEFEAPVKCPRLHERQARTVEFVDTTLDSDDTHDSDTRSNTSHKSNQSRQSSSARQVSSVHGNNTQDVPYKSYLGELLVWGLGSWFGVLVLRWGHGSWLGSCILVGSWFLVAVWVLGWGLESCLNLGSWLGIRVRVRVRITCATFTTKHSVSVLSSRGRV